MIVKARFVWWSFAPPAERIPAVRINRGTHHTVIPLSEARNLSDQLHDICDEYEKRAKQ